MQARIRAWVETDVGCKRQVNQDAVLIDSSLGLFIVADGMGGHRGGEIASQLAVETVREIVQKEKPHLRSRLDTRRLLDAAFREASRRIHEQSLAEESLAGMGTTLLVGLQFGPILFFANVGDSRAYLFQTPYLWQITEDHSLLNEQIRAGFIREEDAGRFTARNVITRSVGFEVNVECDIIERVVQPGDMFILCSDGLTGMVSDDEIAVICASQPPEKIVRLCVESAKLKGGDDNISVMVIQGEPGS